MLLEGHPETGRIILDSRRSPFPTNDGIRNLDIFTSLPVLVETPDFFRLPSILQIDKKPSVPRFL